MYLHSIYSVRDSFFSTLMSGSTLFPKFNTWSRIHADE